MVDKQNISDKSEKIRKNNLTNEKTTLLNKLQRVATTCREFDTNFAAL